MKMEIRFQRDMTCCKSTRVSVELGCPRAVHLCCAVHRADEIAGVKGGSGLDAFARHLLTFWTLRDVFYVFAGAGQMSTLAQICKERWLQLPDSGRIAYRAEVASATNRIETGPYNPPAFMLTFDLLCETASARS